MSVSDAVVPGRASFSGWTAAIAEAFYSPYGLDLQVDRAAGTADKGLPRAGGQERFPSYLHQLTR